MDRLDLSPGARLLLIDCIRRLTNSCTDLKDIREPRVLRVKMSDGNLGMGSCGTFSKYRLELIRAGFLSRYPRGAEKPERDWFMFQCEL